MTKFQPCSICGRVAEDTLQGYGLCQEHFDRIRAMEKTVEWKADVRFLVKKLQSLEVSS